MNAEEFISEIRVSSYGSDATLEMYYNFQKFQKEALNTLIEFHRVCMLNNVHYQLAYGSLLGAIRDNGQIPWDYDIDVFVPIDEKQNLIDSLSNDLHDQFYFYCPEVDNNCRHVIMRIAPIKYRTEVLHVDVFFFTGAPNNKIEREKYKKELKKIAHARYCKLVNANEEAAGKVIKWIRIVREKIPYLFVPLKSIEKKYQYLSTQYAWKDSEYCVTADSFADWYDLPTEYLLNTMEYKTSDGVFMVSKYSKELLELMYGDYMNVPSLDTRLKEMNNHYRRLVRFSKKDNS